MREPLKFIIAVFIGAIFIMASALYNGYPIFYSDSHAYMLAGVESHKLIDHPMTYGYFIKAFSFNGVSLWSVIFFQALMLSWLISLVVKQVLGETGFIVRSLMIILFLSLSTGLSWAASQVMADIFAAIAFLAFFLIVFGNMSKATKAGLYLVFIISIAMHISHILLFSIILILTLVFKRWLLPEERKRSVALIITLLIITICAILPMRYALQHSKYIVFTGAMSEQGILQKYLTEFCPTKNYMLCKYKDSLPDNGLKFLFNPQSPFNKIGGWTPEVMKECEDISIETLTKPKYIGLHILASCKSTFKQLYSFDIDDGNWSFTDSTGTVYSVILKHFKNEAPSYYHSRQSQEKFIGIKLFIIIHRIIEGLSAIFLIGIFIVYRKLFAGIYKLAFLFFLLMVLLNDWDLSTFSSVADRYGCKVAWLIPFLAILGIFKLLDMKKGIGVSSK